MTFSPAAVPARSASFLELEPELLDRVLHHDEMSLSAKTVVVYALGQPRGRVITRAELEVLGRDATPRHLDALLHELVAMRWLETVPADERPCCADGFVLQEDENSEA